MSTCVILVTASECLVQFVRKESGDEPDGYAVMASMASMGGMMLKQKYLSLFGLALALVAFGQGKAKGFSWQVRKGLTDVGAHSRTFALSTPQQFLAALAFALLGIWTTTMAELYPPQNTAETTPAPGAA